MNNMAVTGTSSFLTYELKTALKIIVLINEFHVEGNSYQHMPLIQHHAFGGRGPEQETERGSRAGELGLGGARTGRKGSGMG